MSESSHIIALRKQDKLNRLASERFRVVNGKVEKYKAAPPAQDIEKTISDAIAAETFAPGKLVKGKGVFIGVCRPQDEHGNSLRLAFNMFAAPGDLTDKAGRRQTYTYDEAAARVAALKNWHDHDGADYASEEKLLKDLKENHYKGGWFIPTSQMLAGKDMYGKSMPSPDHLLAHRDEEALKGTFCRVAKGMPNWYWSCTTKAGWQNAYAANFAYGHSGYMDRTKTALSCRPVRLEPVP